MKNPGWLSLNKYPAKIPGLISGTAAGLLCLSKPAQPAVIANHMRTEKNLYSLSIRI
jgi:hypothetical protein